MKRILSLFLALALLLALAPRAFAEEDGEPEELPPESFLPELPKIEPVPAPPAEKNTLCRLLEENSLDYAVDMAGYYLEEMAEAAAEADVPAGRAAEKSRAAALMIPVRYSSTRNCSVCPAPGNSTAISHESPISRQKTTRSAIQKNSSSQISSCGTRCPGCLRIRAN